MTLPDPFWASFHPLYRPAIERQCEQDRDERARSLRALYETRNSSRDPKITEEEYYGYADAPN